MNVIITKEQYKTLTYTLLDNITGGILTIDKESGKKHGVYYIHDSYNEEIMTIHYGSKSGKTPGCKKDLALRGPFIQDFEKYIPLIRKKIFSKVLIDYVYDRTKIKCDCIDYYYTMGSDDNEWLERFIYNLKKKKRFKG